MSGAGLPAQLFLPALDAKQIGREPARHVKMGRLWSQGAGEWEAEWPGVRLHSGDFMVRLHHRDDLALQVG